MASYSFTPSSSGSNYFGGGGWGGDIAGFGHNAYAGMSNGMQFANNLYDLQRRVALEPYAQKSAIANYNANRKQDELAADTYGYELKKQVQMGAISDGTSRNNLAGYNSGPGVTMSTGTFGAAGFDGASTSPIAHGNIGGQVGVVQPTVTPQEMAAQNAYADMILRDKQALQQSMGGQPAQQQVVVPAMQPAPATAPMVDTGNVAIDYTQDPQAGNNAWVNGGFYG